MRILLIYQCCINIVTARCNISRFKRHILDLLFCSEENLVDKLTYTRSSPLGKSDHCVLNFNINCNVNTNEYIKTKKYYNKGYYDNMKKELAEINWDDRFVGIHNDASQMNSGKHSPI